jgi:hypothetical protein
LCWKYFVGISWFLIFEILLLLCSFWFRDIKDTCGYFWCMPSSTGLGEQGLQHRKHAKKKSCWDWKTKWTKFMKIINSCSRQQWIYYYSRNKIKPITRMRQWVNRSKQSQLTSKGIWGFLSCVLKRYFEFAALNYMCFYFYNFMCWEVYISVLTSFVLC